MPEAQQPTAEAAPDTVDSDAAARRGAEARAGDAGRRVDTALSSLPPDQAAAASAGARTELSSLARGPERGAEVRPERAEALRALAAVAERYDQVRESLPQQLKAICDAAKALNQKISADLRQPAVTPEAILRDARTLADMHAQLGIDARAVDTALAALDASSAPAAGTELGSYRAVPRPLARAGYRYPAMWGRPAYYPVRPAYGGYGPRGYFRPGYNAWPSGAGMPYWRGNNYPRTGFNVPPRVVYPGVSPFPRAPRSGPMPGLPPVPGAGPDTFPTSPDAAPPNPTPGPGNAPAAGPRVGPDRPADAVIGVMTPQDIQAAIASQDPGLEAAVLRAIRIDVSAMPLTQLEVRESRPGVSVISVKNQAGAVVGELAVYHAQRMVADMTRPEQRAARAALTRPGAVPAPGPLPGPNPGPNPGPERLPVSPLNTMTQQQVEVAVNGRDPAFKNAMAQLLGIPANAPFVFAVRKEGGVTTVNVSVNGREVGAVRFDHAARTAVDNATPAQRAARAEVIRTLPAAPAGPNGEPAAGPERPLQPAEVASASPEQLAAAIARNDIGVRSAACTTLGAIGPLAVAFSAASRLSPVSADGRATVFTVEVQGVPAGTLRIDHQARTISNISNPQQQARFRELLRTGIPNAPARPDRPSGAPSGRPTGPDRRAGDLPANHPLRGLDARYRALPEGDPQRAELVRQYREQRAATIRTDGTAVYVMKGNAIEKGVVRGGQVVNEREQWSVPLPADANQVWLAAELEGGLGWEMRDAAPAVPRSMPAEFKRRQFEFQDRNAALSEADYHRLFDGQMRQSTGNCYLIALFRGIQESDVGETILRTSVRMLPGGAYEVRVPLGDASSPWRRIEASDLLADRTVMRTVRVRLIDEDGRTVGFENRQEPYEPVQGPTGWKVLEAAYIKYGDERSRGQDRVRRDLTEGGNSDRAARSFLAGIDTTFEGDGRQTLAENDAGRAEVERTLDNFSNGRDLLVAGSRGGASDTQKYTVDGYEFFYGHAYMIRAVNNQARPPTVTVSEPNNIQPNMTVPRSTFMSAFRFVHGGRLNYGRAFGGSAPRS